MTFIEAIRTGLPLTRPHRQFNYRNDTSVMHIYPGTFMAPEMILQKLDLESEDILAEDWQVLWPDIQFEMETVK